MSAVIQLRTVDEHVHRRLPLGAAGAGRRLHITHLEVEQVGVEHDGFSAQLEQGDGLVAQVPGLILPRK